MPTAFAAAGAEMVGPVPSLARMAGVDAERLDLAVLDINLGGEAVYPLADRLVPIVFATGYDASAIPQRCAHIARLEKPVAPSAIMDSVTASGAGIS